MGLYAGLEYIHKRIITFFIKLECRQFSKDYRKSINKLIHSAT